ncbi:hypothetical protein [Photobacterium rosenbergii]|uniref:Uncharacterized protein n=1 Tax=Photobacterium rosenbergii TaxID=294936 RepID=A0ABU3ZDZ9_9GAMM|nr:hypothetical protein [Photobacterium rosenbergii]MDV5168331.1 hypothetical protein [Photobacterium rosenbergii]
MKKYAYLAALMFTTSVSAINTEGYVTIKEVKSWDTTIDVYLSDGQDHKCSDTNYKTRFVADSVKSHHVSFLLTAFSAGKSVSLAYNCDENGYPKIAGIRMR